MQNGYSKLFDSLGLGRLDIGIPILILFIFLVILIIIAIIAIVKMAGMKKRLEAFLCGKDGMSLEETILSVHEENKYLKSCTDRNKKDIRILYKKAEKTLSKVGLVKYDAFQQMG